MTETVSGPVPFKYSAQYNTSKMFHTTKNTQNMTQMAQPVASFKTTTPSAPATRGMTLRQANPVHIHRNTHVHKSTVPVCKPGELIALRKVKHPHNRRTSVNRLPLPKQGILSYYSGCFEGIGCFPGDPYKFHLKPEYKPA